ncbi:MAG TPA: hypothetical protein VH497_17440 [Vicinamibacterales bacterium]
MRLSFIAIVASALLMVCASPLRAQTTDPSGHWTGALEAQGQQFAFEIDIAKDAGGGFAGAVTIPVQHIKGLPLHVGVEGKSIQFYARRDQVFRGELSADGKSITGEFAAEAMTLTYTLTRTGDATVPGPAKSPAVTKALEGVWTGVVEPGGRSAAVTLTIANHPDGTATGLLVNDSQGGLQLPVTIVQDASRVALSVTVLDGTFTGELSAAGELSGMWKEGEKAIPVTFTRAR